MQNTDGKMVEIQTHILNKLKCSYCDSYLSCGPIRMTLDGTKICGRCLSPDDSVVISPYEDVVSNVIFPCRFKKYGCKITDRFNTIKNHEDSCEFTEFTCPIITDGTCNWKGATTMMKAHAKSHKRYLDHPCKINYDFSKTNTITYLTVFEDFIFMIHVKICVTTRKIFHCVRFFGDLDFVNFFEFCLEMKTKSDEHRKRKEVIPFTSLEVEESNSLETSITGLQELFKTLEDIKFTLTINKLFDIFRCIDCKKIIKKYVYQSKNTYKCEKCVPKQINCSGCSVYNDIENKLKKHKNYFCKNTIKSLHCRLCIGSPHNNWYNHLTGIHMNIEIIKWNSEFIYFRESCLLFRSIDSVNYKLIEDENITAICESKSAGNDKYLKIYTSVPQNKLNYDCRIVIKNERKLLLHYGMLEKTDDDLHDWFINLNTVNITEHCVAKLILIPKDINKHPQLNK